MRYRDIISIEPGKRADLIKKRDKLRGLVRLAMAEAAANGASHLWWPTWPEQERQRMMNTHIEMGSRFPSVKLNTTYSFGFNAATGDEARFCNLLHLNGS